METTKIDIQRGKLNSQYYIVHYKLYYSFDEFDNRMFGISEPEAAKMDPQQRYVLECVHMALEDGGIKRKDIHGSKTGVYIGTYVHMKY